MELVQHPSELHSMSSSSSSSPFLSLAYFLYFYIYFLYLQISEGRKSDMQIEFQE